eukprot:2766753-Pyramimonas_sp.AAC.1
MSPQVEIATSWAQASCQPSAEIEPIPDANHVVVEPPQAPLSIHLSYVANPVAGICEDTYDKDPLSAPCRRQPAPQSDSEP